MALGIEVKELKNIVSPLIAVIIETSCLPTYKKEVLHKIDTKLERKYPG